MRTYIRKINNLWYAFGADTDKCQVYSIGRDSPKEGLYYAKLTDAGIQYVATWSPNRFAAYRKAARAGWYCGEI